MASTNTDAIIEFRLAAERGEIDQLLDAGTSRTKIAEMYGVSPRAVYARFPLPEHKKYKRRKKSNRPFPTIEGARRLALCTKWVNEHEQTGNSEQNKCTPEQYRLFE